MTEPNKKYTFGRKKQLRLFSRYFYNTLDKRAFTTCKKIVPMCVALFLLNQVLSRNEMWSFYYSAESYFYYSTYPYHGTRSEQRYEI